MVNPVGTNSLITGDIRKNAEKFASLSDNDLLYLAHNKTVSDQKEKRNRNFNNAVMKTVPIIDSAIFASQKKELLPLTAGSTLAPTLGAFATRLANWGFFLGVFDLSSKMLDKATKKSEKLSDIKEKHPLAYTAADLGLGFAAYTGAKKAGLHILNKIPANTKKKVVDQLITVKERINTSSLSKKVFEPLLKRAIEFTNKHPKIQAQLPNLKKYAVPVVLTGMLIKMLIIDPISMNKKLANNFNELKTDQEAIKMLLNVAAGQESVSEEI